jgi:cytidine deaminase
MDLYDILYNTAMKSNLIHKYSCAIILRNKILSIGYNYYKAKSWSTDIYECNKYSIHAEKHAIMKIKNKNILKYCKIYIIKIKNNDIEDGIPCPMCYHLLNKYKLNIKEFDKIII